MEVNKRGESPARIQYLHVENYRALKNVTLKDITPLTVLLGPKRTLFPPRVARANFIHFPTLRLFGSGGC